MDLLKGKMNSKLKPNLVVLDLNMPRKDGRTALQEIKSDPDLMDVPIVVLTTSSFDADINYCQRYDVAGYYRKPNSVIELQEIISRLCLEYLS